MTVSPRRDLTLPRRVYSHGFPEVRLRLGVKGTNERGWSTADPPFDGWDEKAQRPGIRGWIEERGGNVGVRSGPAPRLEPAHPGFRFSYWLDLDWGHLVTPGDHTEIRQSYDELVAFVRLRALLFVRSVSGDDSYGALFAGSRPYATKTKLLEAGGVDLIAFYGVTTTGGGDQKVIPPSRIIPELLDTDEQRARLKRTEYEVVVDALDDPERWVGQDAALEWLVSRFALVPPGKRMSEIAGRIGTITGRTEPNAEPTSDQAEVLHRLEEMPLGRAHVEVLRVLRELGHRHGQGHAETRWALSAPLALTGADRELILDMLGYPRGDKCRTVRGRRLVDQARKHPVPFGETRLRRVALYADLPSEYFEVPTRLERRIRRYASLPWRGPREILGDPP